MTLFNDGTLKKNFLRAKIKKQIAELVGRPGEWPVTVWGYHPSDEWIESIVEAQMEHEEKEMVRAERTVIGSVEKIRERVREARKNATNERVREARKNAVNLGKPKSNEDYCEHLCLVYPELGRLPGDRAGLRRLAEVEFGYEAGPHRAMVFDAMRWRNVRVSCDGVEPLWGDYPGREYVKRMVQREPELQDVLDAFFSPGRDHNCLLSVSGQVVATWGFNWPIYPHWVPCDADLFDKSYVEQQMAAYDNVYQAEQEAAKCTQTQFQSATVKVCSDKTREADEIKCIQKLREQIKGRRDWPECMGERLEIRTSYEPIGREVTAWFMCVGCHKRDVFG